MQRRRAARGPTASATTDARSRRLDRARRAQRELRRCVWVAPASRGDRRRRSVAYVRRVQPRPGGRPFGIQDCDGARRSFSPRLLSEHRAGGQRDGSGDRRATSPRRADRAPSHAIARRRARAAAAPPGRRSGSVASHRAGNARLGRRGGASSGEGTGRRAGARRWPPMPSRTRGGSGVQAPSTRRGPRPAFAGAVAGRRRRPAVAVQRPWSRSTDGIRRPSRGRLRSRGRAARRACQGSAMALPEQLGSAIWMIGVAVQRSVAQRRPMRMGARGAARPSGPTIDRSRPATTRRVAGAAAR